MNLLENQTVVISADPSQLEVVRATVKALLSFGAQTVILGRDKPLIEAALAEFSGQSLVVEVDPCNNSLCEQAFESIIARHQRIDALINMPGLIDMQTEFDFAPDKLAEIFAANSSQMLGLGKLYPRFINRDQGGSFIQVMPPNSEFAGSASAHASFMKESMLSLSRSMATELSEHNIRVNTLIPGFVYDEHLHGAMSFEACDEAIHSIPLQRSGRIQDIAGSCVFLASELSSYITGMALYVDGGVKQLGMRH